MPRNGFLQEFRPRNLLLTHPNPSYFTISQWKWSPYIYVLYRVVVALYFLVWLILSGVFGSKVKWFIYLTNWSFFLLTLNNVVTAVTAVHDFITDNKDVKEKDGEPDAKEMRWFLKVQWVIYNIAMCAAVTVTVAYWSLLWKPSDGVDAIGFTVHGFNSIYVMLDLFATSMPVRLLHAWHTTAYALVYILFTLIYCGVGGTSPSGDNYIYPVLDFYGKPKEAIPVAVVGMLVGVPLVWLFVYGVAALRVFLAERCCSCGRNYRQGLEGEVSPEVGPSAPAPTLQQAATVESGSTNEKSTGIFSVETARGITNIGFESEKL